MVIITCVAIGSMWVEQTESVSVLSGLRSAGEMMKYVEEEIKEGKRNEMQ